MRFLRSLFGFSAKPGGVVLALGGGGARGLAHIGALEVLEDGGIPIAGIAGTSAGAIIGAMWITLGSAVAVARRWREFLGTDTLKALPDVTIESLRVKFAAVATDFETGEPVALRHGPLRVAVAASCAIPAVVPPYSFGGRHLTDGGTVADVPVAQARTLSRCPVVAVSVGEAWRPEDAAGITLAQAMMRASNMTHKALRDAQLASADLVIAPDVGALHWSEFTRLDEAAAAGRAAAESVIRRAQALALCRPRRRQAEEPQ
jgi:NTE family protein